jgi:hypothetical protein
MMKVQFKPPVGPHRRDALVLVGLDVSKIIAGPANPGTARRHLKASFLTRKDLKVGNTIVLSGSRTWG